MDDLEQLVTELKTNLDKEKARIGAVMANDNKIFESKIISNREEIDKLKKFINISGQQRAWREVFKLDQDTDLPTALSIHKKQIASLIRKMQGLRETNERIQGSENTKTETIKATRELMERIIVDQKNNFDKISALQEEISELQEERIIHQEGDWEEERRQTSPGEWTALVDTALVDDDQWNMSGVGSAPQAHAVSAALTATPASTPKSDAEIARQLQAEEEELVRQFKQLQEEDVRTRLEPEPASQVDLSEHVELYRTPSDDSGVSTDSSFGGGGKRRRKSKKKKKSKKRKYKRRSKKSKTRRKR